MADLVAMLPQEGHSPMEIAKSCENEGDGDLDDGEEGDSDSDEARDWDVCLYCGNARRYKELRRR